jgi:hypothetical protein
VFLTQLYIGTLTVVLDHPLLHGLTAAESSGIANDYLAVLKQSIGAQHFPFEVTFELVEARSGCVSVKVKVFIAIATFVGSAIAGSVAFVIKYPEFRKALPAFVKDAGNLYNCYVRNEKIACTAVLKTLQITEHLYVVKQGDTLTRIVSEEWSVPKDRRTQVMTAVVRRNPEAFIGGDINQLKAGATLVQPTEDMLRGVPGS